MSNNQSIDQNDTNKATRAISILDFLVESEIDNEPGSLEGNYPPPRGRIIL